MLSRVVVVEIATNSGTDAWDNVAAGLHVSLVVLVAATERMKIGPGLGTVESKLKLSSMRFGIVAVAVISRGGHGD